MQRRPGLGLVSGYGLGRGEQMSRQCGGRGRMRGQLSLLCMPAQPALQPGLFHKSLDCSTGDLVQLEAHRIHARSLVI